MIPKIIHYCWFGGNKKPKLIRECISSWENVLPEYKIIEWNESNSDLIHPFVKEAYKLKKWAFVADYIRLKALFDFGGIYLDTDMMALKSFDSLLDNQCFFGSEDIDFVSCGIIGAEKNFKLILDFLMKYNSIYIDCKWDLITMPILITRQIRERFNFKGNFSETIDFSEVIIYETEFFYPLPNKKRMDTLNYSKYITSKSFAIHFWAASWVEHDQNKNISNISFLTRFSKFLGRF
jgi:hypothetical protein